MIIVSSFSYDSLQTACCCNPDTYYEPVMNGPESVSRCILDLSCLYSRAVVVPLYVFEFQYHPARFASVAGAVSLLTVCVG